MDRAPWQKEERSTESESTTLPALESPEESIPQSIIPWNYDDDRSRYLGLRASGFSIREALGLIGKAKSTLSAWRHDPKFNDLEENKLKELRSTLALEYAGLESLRNFRLVMEKDFRVLKKSLEKNTRTIVDKDGDETIVNVPMESQDFQYLMKMRAYYSPQQLAAIEQLFGTPGVAAEGGGWMEMAMRRTRTETEEVVVRTRHRQESNLGEIRDA